MLGILPEKELNKYEKRYEYIDKENKIIYEYLISADDNHIVIVWDILNNFEIKQKIDNHQKLIDVQFNDLMRLQKEKNDALNRSIENNCKEKDIKQDE